MLIPMRVKTVTHTPGAPTAVIVLETLTEERALALAAPLDEASRLGRVLGLGPCRCAPIYDLVDALVAALGTSITRAVLDAREDGIGACLTLGASLTVPCHPADALALAARGQAPVFASADALAFACPAGPHDHPASAAPAPTEIAAAPSPEGERDLTAWLSGLRPSDFAVELRRPDGDPPNTSAGTTT
jgi:bifunctional DNase/RNase